MRRPYARAHSPSGTAAWPWLGTWRMAMAIGLATTLFAFSATPRKALFWNWTPEIQTHVELICAFEDGLREGAWPVREAPRVSRVDSPVFQRYPFFQFYGNFPYLLGALMMRCGQSGYQAYLGMGFLSFFAGFLGVVALARHWGVRPAAGLAAAAAFTLAPYHLGDWYGRAAFPETIAFGMLPWVLCGSLRAARGWDFPALLLSALLWAALIQTHTITHLFSALFILGYAAWLALPPQGDWRRLAYPLLAYALGLAASAWQFIPIVLFGPHVGIARHFLPQDWAFLSPWKVLVWPVFTGVPRAGITGLQAGWAMLAAWVVSLFLERRERTLAAFFALAFFMVWSPLNFWPWLGPLQIVQFPYRLLTLTNLFGAALLALVWNRLPARLDLLLLPLMLGALGAATRSYFFQAPSSVDDYTASSAYAAQGVTLRSTRYQYHFEDPDQGPLGRRNPSLASPAGPFRAWPDGVEVKAPTRLPADLKLDIGLWTRVELRGVEKGSLILLPSPWYPNLYSFELNGVPAPYGRLANRLALRAGQDGDLVIRYRFRGLPLANAVSLLAWTLMLGLAALALRRSLPAPDRKTRGLAALASWARAAPARIKALAGELFSLGPP